MPNQSPAGQIIESLVRFRKWWLLPTLVCTVLAICYALFSEKSYSSRQTLIVRDDLVGTFYKPGRFDSLDSMKSAQETILELSRRPNVVRVALERLGPPALTTQNHWLSDQVVEETQGKIQISAPNGAEFGRTEAIVLSVSEGTRERSKQFISYLLDEIEKSLKDLRARQFASMEIELEQAANVAKRTYDLSANELRTLEQSVGADLSTLISLNDSQAGTNNLQSELANLSVEQRNAWANLEDVKKQIQILQDVAQSPETLPEVPQELLQLQPTLASLAKGLSDAVLKYSTTKGKYEPSHPNAGQDFRAIQDIKLRIKDKLVGTLNSLQYQLELRQGRYDKITNSINKKKIRLGELSSMRVDYATLREDVAKKREINGKANANLAEIQTLGGAAKQVNLLARIDEPQTDIYPDGPSNKIIVFGGTAAGLFIGLGMVMFIAPLDFENVPTNQRRPRDPDENRVRRPSRNTGENEFTTPNVETQTEPQPFDSPQLSSASTSARANGPEATNRKSGSIRPSTAPAFATADDGKNDTSNDSIVERSFSTISDQITGVGNAGSTPVVGEPQSKPKSDFEAVSSAKKQPVEIQVPDVLKKEATPNQIEAPALAAKEDIAQVVVKADLNSQEPTTSALETVLSNIRSKHKEASGTDVPNIETDVAIEKTGVEAPAYTNLPGAQDVLTSTSDSFDSLSEYINQAQTENESPLQNPESYKEFKLDNLVPDVPGDEGAGDKPTMAIQVPFVDPTKPDPELSTVQDRLELPSTPNSWSSKNETFAATAAAIQSIAESDDSAFQQPATSDSTPIGLIDNSSAESNEINAAEIEPPAVDFSNLRIGGDNPTASTENLSQPEQGETKNDSDTNPTIQPISNIESSTLTDQADESSSINNLSTGLPLDTSIHNSSEKIGDESDPNAGVKPENRPTATTVDLRMLKDQLSGKGKQANPSTTLSDVLSKGADEVPASEEKNEVVDQNISDLANSIRNMCQRKNEEGPDAG